jgi:hypothetical protein
MRGLNDSKWSGGGREPGDPSNGSPLLCVSRRLRRARKGRCLALSRQTIFTLHLSSFVNWLSWRPNLLCTMFSKSHFCFCWSRSYVRRNTSHDNCFSWYLTGVNVTTRHASFANILLAWAWVTAERVLQREFLIWPQNCSFSCTTQIELHYPVQNKFFGTYFLPASLL